MAAAKKEEIIQRATAEQQKKFSLASFKKKKGFSSNSIKFKPQTWIPLSKAWQDVTSLPGIPQGHITLLRGHSDTGKSTTLLECAASCQRMGILPVFIITEMKWSWEFAKKMGVQVEEVYNKETGEVEDYDGFFLYVDRGSLNTIEDVANYIGDLLDEQAKGRLPYDLCFLWDSVGSVPCEQSVNSNKNNNQWNAGAMSTQFSGWINQKIPLSRKEASPYTNTLVCINKIWVSPPESFLGQPKMNNKGGESMYYDASVCFTYGNISNAGTSKIKAAAGGKAFEFAKRTKISCDKNHITGVQSVDYIVMTPTGFIHNDKKEIDAYAAEHKEEWRNIIGTDHFDIDIEPVVGETPNNLVEDDD